MKTYKISGSKIESLKDFEIEIINILREVKCLNLPKIIKNDIKSQHIVGSLISIHDYIMDLADNENPIAIEIVNTDYLRKVLGYDATQVEKTLTLNKFKRNFPLEIEKITVLESDLDLSRSNQGPTLFSLIIQDILENQNITLKMN